MSIQKPNVTKIAKMSPKKRIKGLQTPKFHFKFAYPIHKVYICGKENYSVIDHNQKR